MPRLSHHTGERGNENPWERPGYPTESTLSLIIGQIKIDDDLEEKLREFLEKKRENDEDKNAV